MEKKIKKISKSRTLTLIAIAFASSIIMSLYELSKQAVFPEITRWWSHIITIVFVTVLSTLIAHLMLYRVEILKSLKQAKENIKNPEKRLIFPLLKVFGFMLVLMTIYEWLKQVIKPDISIWTSHIATIIFSSCLAVIAAYLVLKKMDVLNKQLKEDIKEHIKMEGELKAKNEQLERFTNLAIGREKRMIEMKMRIQDLERDLNERR
jgi:hypothetical protein